MADDIEKKITVLRIIDGERISIKRVNDLLNLNQGSIGRFGYGPFRFSESEPRPGLYIVDRGHPNEDDPNITEDFSLRLEDPDPNTGEIFIYYTLTRVNQ